MYSIQQTPGAFENYTDPATDLRGYQGSLMRRIALIVCLFFAPASYAQTDEVERKVDINPLFEKFLYQGNMVCFVSTNNDLSIMAASPASGCCNAMNEVGDSCSICCPEGVQSSCHPGLGAGLPSCSCG